MHIEDRFLRHADDQRAERVTEHTTVRDLINRVSDSLYLFRKRKKGRASVPCHILIVSPVSQSNRFRIPQRKYGKALRLSNRDAQIDVIMILTTELTLCPWARGRTCIKSRRVPGLNVVLLCGLVLGSRVLLHQQEYVELVEWSGGMPRCSDGWPRYSEGCKRDDISSYRYCPCFMDPGRREADEFGADFKSCP